MPTSARSSRIGCSATASTHNRLPPIASCSGSVRHGQQRFRVQIDQRGIPRVEGSATDIGAFESDRLVGNAFDPQ
jgi:hypothetical protein